MEDNPVGPATSRNLSHGIVAANGCKVCIPMSLEVGVGIQLTFFPRESVCAVSHYDLTVVCSILVIRQ